MCINSEMKNENKESDPPKDVKVTSSILDAFDLLRTPKDNAKVTGAAQIILQVQGKEGGSELQYALKRLVRSLGANVPEARSGYFATLVTLLSSHQETTAAQLLELVKKELHASGGSKSEVGDVALGQILVCGALFRSGLMLRSSEEEQTAVVQLLLTASKKKSYLTTVAYLILMDFVDTLTEEQFTSIVWPHLKPELKKELKDQTLDSLHALLVTSSRFPAKVKLHKLIGTPNLICEDNLQDLCDKIMAGIDFSSVTHPIYSALATRVANSRQLLAFWTAIDPHLLKHNRNRELVALNMLTNILDNIQDNLQVIPELLSRNFFKLFMDWFKGLQTASKIRNKRDNEDDNKLMIKKEKELIHSLTKALKSDKVDSKIRVETLKKLLFNPGEINFSEITGTTIVKSVMSDLDRDGVRKMAKQLKGVLLNTSQKHVKEGVERHWYNNERVRAADLIAYLVNHDTVKDDTDFKLGYMKLLMCFGFFKISGDQDMAVSTELSGAIKACFYRCFNSRYSNVDNLVTVLSSLCNFICGILKKEQIRVKMEKQFPKENMECWEMLTEVCQKIEKNDSKSKVDKVFLILLYQLGLFLFSEPTYVKLAQDSIKELKSCYDHYRKVKKKTNGHLTDEPEWIEVLVEVLLSILSAESSVLRSIVQCVFRLLWEDLTPSSIGQIVSVLDPDSETNPLTNDSDSEADDDGEKSADENNDDKSGENGEMSDDDSESDSGVEPDDDEDMKTPDQLRMAVQKALGAAAESDNESLDADMIDEEEGKKLDDALAQAFQQFHQGKGKKTKKDRKDKKALSDFRIRVLDLVDIYLEKDPAMDICLGMIAPLTRCLETCILDPQFTELGNRVRKTIKLLAKIRKFTSTEDVTMDTLCDCLKSNIDKGNRSHFLYQALGDVITHLATFIIHCSQKIETKSGKSPKKEKSSPLLNIFKEALHSYFHNRNCLLPIIFFHNVLQTEWEGTYELVPIVTENVFNKDVRQFRRSEGLELIAGFYRALKRIKPTSDKLVSKLSKLEENFENNLKKTLSTEGFEAKNNFYVTLRKLINTMKMFHESCHVESSLDFKSLLDTVGSCKGIAKVKSNQVQNNVSEEPVKKNKKSKKKKGKKRKQQPLNGQVPPQKKIRKISVQSE